MRPAGHVARKRFGQHFLTDRALIADIVAAVGGSADEALIEIGPGLGALTQPLLARHGALTVVEIDRDLAARWRAVPGITVIEADVLTVDFRALAAAAGKPLRVVGNLPYNISTPILFHLLQAAEVVREQWVMLQAEVVERMAAGPGSKAYGRLSVMLQWRYAIERVIEVPPEAFRPPPAVDSAVARMTPLAELPVPAQQVEGLQRLLGEAVTCAFSQRRKLLRHTLGAWLEQRSLHSPFDLQRRAEEVPVAEYVALARAALEAETARDSAQPAKAE